MGDQINIPVRLLAEIGLVHLLGILIPFRGKNILTTVSFKAQADTANPGEKVDGFVHTEVLAGLVGT